MQLVHVIIQFISCKGLCHSKITKTPATSEVLYVFILKIQTFTGLTDIWNTTFLPSLSARNWLLYDSQFPTLFFPSRQHELPVLNWCFQVSLLFDQPILWYSVWTKLQNACFLLFFFFYPNTFCVRPDFTTADEQRAAEQFFVFIIYIKQPRANDCRLTIILYIGFKNHLVMAGKPRPTLTLPPIPIAFKLAHLLLTFWKRVAGLEFRLSWYLQKSMKVNLCTPNWYIHTHWTPL